MRTVTSSPSIVGTFISAPSAASVKVTGRDINKFNSFLEKTGCFTTLTVTNKSPGPAGPLPPRPFNLIFAPSFIPPGIRVVTELAFPPCGASFKSSSVPNIESLNEIVVVAAKSWPRLGPCPAPKIVPKISCDPPPPNKSEKSAP